MSVSVLSRLLASRLLRVGLVALALAFCVYGLATNWEETRHALSQLSWLTLVGAFAAGVAGLFAWMLAWRSLLAEMGSKLPVRTAVRVFFVALLGKYVPGGVWALVAQVELARDHHVPRERGANATLLAMATTIATGCAVAAITLPLTSGDAAKSYWWLLLLAPFGLAALHPRVMSAMVGFAARLIRRPAPQQTVGAAAMSRAAGWTLLGWTLQGVQAWLLIRAAGGHGSGLLFVSIGAYALAFTAGFLVVFAPGGIGAREAAFVLALAPVMPDGAGIVVALASRVIMTLADLAWAGVAVLLGRLSAPKANPESPILKSP